jgi:large subunit ribosomal protein L11
MPPRKVIATVKLDLDAAQASPITVGKALGARGINMPEFIKAYNAATAAHRGDVIPAVVTVFDDRSFAFETRTPPTAGLLARAAGIVKGSARPHDTPAGSISEGQLRDVARRKLPDLNTDDLEVALRIVAGTARQMGIAVRG